MPGLGGPLSMPVGGPQTTVPTYSIEDAIRNWVIAGSGFANDRVWFNDQKVDRKGGPFITIKLDSFSAMGAVDEVLSVYDSSRPQGQEIEKQVRGYRELVARIQVWGAPTVDRSVSWSCMEIARKIQLSGRLPSIQDTFDDAGINLNRTGPVTNLSTLLDTDFDGRASFDAYFYMLETVSEYIGYIAEVDLVDTDTSTTFVIKEG